MAGAAQLGKHLRRELFRRGRVRGLEKVLDQFAVHGFELFQVHPGGGGVGVPRRLDCLEDQVGHAAHGRNHYHDAVLPCRAVHDRRALPEALRVAHGGPPELHDNQTLPAHSGLPNFCKTAPSLSTSGTISRVTPAPLLSATVNNTSLSSPSSAKIFRTAS